VGFGISTPAQAGAVGRFADGVVVGSAIVRLIEEAPSKAPARVERFARSMVAAMEKSA
jgi:tryptophan synthase alpha chain